jgi:hypothetical protein
MGKRLYVATKYEVSYDSTAGFNWNFEEYKEVLKSLDVTIYGDEDGYADEWEVSKEEFDNALDFLENNKEAIYNYGESDNNPDFDGYVMEDIYDAIMDIKFGDDFDDKYGYVVEMMRLWKNERAANGDYMHFSTF